MSKQVKQKRNVNPIWQWSAVINPVLTILGIIFYWSIHTSSQSLSDLWKIKQHAPFAILLFLLILAYSVKCVFMTSGIRRTIAIVATITNILVLGFILYIYLALAFDPSV